MGCIIFENFFTATNLIAAIPLKSFSVTEDEEKEMPVTVLNGNPGFKFIEGSFLAKNTADEKKMSTKQHYLVMNFPLSESDKNTVLNDNIRYGKIIDNLQIRTSVRKDIIWCLCNGKSGEYIVSRRQVLDTAFSYEGDGRMVLFNSTKQESISFLSEDLKNDWVFHKDDITLKLGEKDGYGSDEMLTVPRAYLGMMSGKKGVHFKNLFTPVLEPSSLQIQNGKPFSWLKSPTPVSFNF